MSGRGLVNLLSSETVSKLCLETHRLSLLLRRGEVHMLSFVNSFRKCIPSLKTPSLVESKDSSWCDMFLHERLCMDVCGSLWFPLSLSQEKDDCLTVTERSTGPGLLFNMRILRQENPGCPSLLEWQFLRE